VVVGDDDIDAGFTQPGNRGDRGGATVAGDDELRSSLDGGIDSGIAQVVAVFDAARDERHRLAAELAHGPREKRRGADAIDVVIAMDENELFVPDRAREALDSLVHGEKAERIM
jgi:hypothetical protein